MPAAKTPKPPKALGRFRIFLAASESITPDEFAGLPYPLMVSFKEDGIRLFCSPEPQDRIEEHLVHGWGDETQAQCWRAPNADGAVYPLTRSLKEVGNLHARKLLATLPAGSDGEAGVVIDGVLNFRESTSAINAEEGEPDIRFFIFDNPLLPGGKWARYEQLLAMAPGLPLWCHVLEQRMIETPEALAAMHAEAKALGKEGLITAIPAGHYKPNRATRGEGLLCKVKDKTRIEITITGMEEEEENLNEKTRDERGLAKRSSHKANQRPRGRMGVLIGRAHGDAATRFGEQDIRVGSGYEHAFKQKVWDERDDPEKTIIGQLATIEFIDAGGYDAPRSAVFKGIRHLSDLS